MSGPTSRVASWRWLLVVALGLGLAGGSYRLWRGGSIFGLGAVEHPLDLAPTKGSQAGGQSVRIEGEDFTGHGPLSVYFGPRGAKGVVIESPWLVTVVAPQVEEPGTVDVLLRFGDGTELKIPEAYTYVEQEGIILRPSLGGS